MNKFIKRSIMSTFILFIFLICSNFERINAESSTALVKGYNTTNLTYVSDKDSGIQRIYSNKDTLYGTVSLWAATYKVVIKNTDNTYTAYYVILIESQISSVGKQGKYYFFRNKDLDIELNFNSIYKSVFIQSTTASEEATGSASKNFGLGISGGYSNGLTLEGEASLSVGYTENYNNINLSIEKDHDSDCGDLKHQIKFNYHFNKWKNGAMISPNIGSITKKMYAIYSVPNYDFIDRYSFTIETTATVFKDAKWPRKNYTESKSLKFSASNGVFN